MNGGKRIMLDMWLEYCMQHEFKGLHCLCPLLRTTDEELPFTEAKILLKDSGDHIGEYIAECLNGHCKYLGQLPVAFRDKESLMRWEKIVSLEQKYGIPEKTHAPKGRLFHRKVRCTC